MLEIKTKKTEGKKKCTIERKHKIQDYESCLEATQLKNEINHLEKAKVDVDSLKQNHKEFIKN